MNGELDEFRKAFRAEAPIVPRREAREEAIAAAARRYSENSAQASQGNASGLRLMNRLRGFIQRSTSMHSIKLTHALMAGTSIAVLGLAVISVSQMRDAFTGHPVKNLDNKQIQVVGGEKTEADALGKSKSSAVSRLNDEEGRVAGVGGQKVAEPARELERQDAPADTRFRFAAKPAAPADKLAQAPASAARSEIGQLSAAPTDSSDVMRQGYHDQGRDKFTDIKTNPVKVVAEEPVSTFSIDVDTASYSFVRGSLSQNVLPQKDAVRVEEMINYFPYDYAGPADRAEPFKATVTLMPTPWNPDTRLMHIGIKGFSLNGREKPKSNLVFLIDSSGSMEEPNKLPLLRNSLKMLTDSLSPDDTVAIVVYAGSAGTVLEPTKVKDKAKIIAALDNLSAGGSTAGAEGIRQAYQLAEQNFDKAGINRVILATDGDFNVGITDPEELKSFVERKRESGVFLSVLGFGRGNYNDELMQTLAQNGNGNAAYIDTLNEARKVLVDEASSTLFPIAKDVKIQVEFNPQTVSEYRLIGYETRMLNREDFNNDKVDAGEIGAGHTVTAIYEITPKDSKAALVDPLRYGQTESAKGQGGEYAFLKIRYKLPNESQSKLITQPVTDANLAPSKEADFAAAVAGFGQLLRGGQYTKSFTYDDVIALAQSAKGADPYGYRAEFINLARMAKTAQGLEPLKP
jgi:Ca-activated chloride channel family protein